MTSNQPPATLVCQVCGTENPATRQFCRKCAADLRAPVAAPVTPTAPEPSGLPIGPVLIGGGIALVVIALLVVGFGLLGGGPAATPTLAPTPTAAPTLAPATPTPAPTPAITATPEVTAAPTAQGTVGPSVKPALTSFTVPRKADCNGENGTGQVGMISISWVAEGVTGVRVSIDPPSAAVAYDYGYQDYLMPSGSAVVPFTCGAPNHDGGGDYHLYVVWTLHSPNTYAQYRFMKVYQSP